MGLGDASVVEDVRFEHGGRPVNGALGFFVWFQIWLDWLWAGCDFGCGVGSDVSGGQDLPNRYLRRLERCTLPPVRNFGVFWFLFPRGISGGQYMELLCRLSPLGRARIYGFVYYGSVLQRRALLVCYDHGWWREPLGVFGRVRCGVWRVHLWPGWWFCVVVLHDVSQEKPRAERPGMRISRGLWVVFGHQ